MKTAGTLSLLLVLAGLAHAQPPADAPKLTKPPRLLTFVKADYPEGEKAAGREAVVVLRLTLDAEGAVGEAAVETSAGAAFDAAALAAARQFRFEPAEIDGKPAPIRILYRYEFVLEKVVRTTAELTGVVRNRKTRQPLPGITLTVEGQTATTDASGRFAFPELAAGKQAVALAGPAITAVRTEETLEAGKKTDVIYDVSVPEKVDPADKDDLEIVVVAPRPLRRAVASVEIAADQGRRVPGTQGDVLKVVESLPGVARASAGSGQLVVWGAAPQDTRVYIDGVRVPALYHTSGLRSVYAGDLVRAIELVPGGYGASHGRGLGGVVLVQTAPLAGEGVHGAVTADVLDASAALRATLAPRLRLAAAGRVSYLDRTFALASDRDVGDLFPIPRYRDAQARLGYQLDARTDLELDGLYSRDEVTRTVTSSDPAFTKRDLRTLSFWRGWARYRRELEDGVVELVPFFGRDRARATSQFGGPETTGAADSTLYGFRGSWRGRLSRRVTLALGLDGEVVTTTLQRAGSLAVPAREGDQRAFGQAPPAQINHDSWSMVAASAAPHAELDLSLADDRLHVIPGLRVEPIFTSASRRTPVVGETPPIGLFAEETAVQPRLTVRFAPLARLALNASYGQYRQPPQAEDLSAVFGNPALPVARGTHYVAGASLRLAEGLVAEVTVFHSRSSRLAARTPLSSPLLAQALVAGGRGRSTGGQVVLRRELARGLFGWLSYSLLRAERSDPVAEPACTPMTAACAGAPRYTSGPWRLFDQDQTHLFTAVAAYALGAGFEAGLRLRYATGFPRTPVTGAVHDSRLDVYQPLFGAHNSTRLPAFFQADVRLARTTKLAGSTLEVYLDVQNVTNRRNAEEFAYGPDYSERRTISGLPILPVLGARLAW
jgi:TonB family protein